LLLTPVKSIHHYSAQGVQQIAHLLSSITCYQMLHFSCLIKHPTIILFVVIFLIIAGSCFTGLYSKSDLGPDGFRGIKWGTDIKLLNEMQYVRVDPKYPGNDVFIYHRKGDRLRINGATLSSIEYRFWRGLFFNVEIHTKGLSNFMCLLKDTLDTFGQEHNTQQHVDKYYWYGNKASIVLEYISKSQNGLIWIQGGDCSLINEQLKLSDKTLFERH
jgi:hypothetical protein